MVSVGRVEDWLAVRIEPMGAETIPGPPDRAAAAVAEIVDMAALWRQFRRELPDVDVTPEVMSVLQEACSPDYFLSASEFPTGEWFGGEACVAAARLAALGQGQDVLIACALLAHGYDYCGGGVALSDGYLMLLPAIVSALSPDTFWETPALGIPPCWGQDEYDQSVELNHDARVLRPGASMAERWAAAHAPEASIFFPGHPSYEAAWEAREIAARALGLVPSRIWDEPLTDSPEFSWTRLVDAAEAWDQHAIDQLHYASLLYWIGSESHLLLGGESLDEPSDRIAEALPWTMDWHVTAFEWQKDSGQHGDQQRGRYSLARWFGRQNDAYSREETPWRLGKV